ncbi:Clostridial hydrophobic W [uncultured Collinsella sp.]|nr:Clostridial hydrophobic W [uncultured Collinsella sp.]
MRRVTAFFLAAVLFAYPILQPVALYALESQLDGVTQLDSTDQDTAQDDAPSIDSQQDEESPNDGGENGQNGSSPASTAGDPSASGDAGRGTLPDSIDVLQGVNGEEDPASSSQDETSEIGLPVLTYQAHVQVIGWQAEVADGERAGTTGQSKGIEAIRVFIADGAEDAVQIQAHAQDIGCRSMARGWEMVR